MSDKKCCGSCSEFRLEDIYGDGICGFYCHETSCVDYCEKWVKRDLTEKE